MGLWQGCYQTFSVACSHLHGLVVAWLFVEKDKFKLKGSIYDRCLASELRRNDTVSQTTSNTDDPPVELDCHKKVSDHPFQILFLDSSVHFSYLIW